MLYYYVLQSSGSICNLSKHMNDFKNRLAGAGSRAVSPLLPLPLHNLYRLVSIINRFSLTYIAPGQFSCVDLNEWWKNYYIYF